MSDHHARYEIDLDYTIDRWKWRCPRGHTSWEPTNCHFYCTACADQASQGEPVEPTFEELTNQQTGETVPRDRLVLRSELGNWRELQGKDELGASDAGDGLATDGGREAHCFELTGFQRDLLVCVVAMDRERGPDDPPATGQAIMDRVNETYPTSVTHGSLYPNLDALDEAGLVEKDSIDGRTNGYRPTERGVAALEARVDLIAAVIDVQLRRPHAASTGGST
jgi:hypothetical protein